MAEILLCNQPTRLSFVEDQSDKITGLGCANPDILNSYTPYVEGDNLSPTDRNIMHLLSPMPVARELTNFSLSYGEDNTLALVDLTLKLKDYNTGVLGASTSIYAKRIGGFAGSVQDYQDALMQYREAIKANPATKAAAKQKAMTAFQRMQMRFRHELNVVNASVKSKKGTPLTSFTRGANIANSSRNVTKLKVADKIQAHNLVKFSQYAKILGNGLAVIDFSSRVGKVHNSYRAGGEWERDLFIESSSFAASALAGVTVVNAGTAALGFLMVATPLGWIGLIIGGVAIAGAAAGAALWTNSQIKSHSGDWYDGIMAAVSAP